MVDLMFVVSSGWDQLLVMDARHCFSYTQKGCCPSRFFDCFHSAVQGFVLMSATFLSLDVELLLLWPGNSLSPANDTS